jgi:hypothetical protein
MSCPLPPRVLSLSLSLSDGYHPGFCHDAEGMTALCTFAAVMTYSATGGVLTPTKVFTVYGARFSAESYTREHACDQ